MAFCINCGAKLPDAAKFCAECGTAVHKAEETKYENTASNNEAYKETAHEVPPQQEKSNTAEGKSGAFDDFINEMKNTADETGNMDAEDVKNNKVFAIFAYIGWLVLIPILAAPNSKFARFHANQGLVLAIISTGWAIADAILVALFSFLFYPVGVIIGAVMGIAAIAFVALMIIGIVNVAENKAKELPIIGKIKILK